MSFWSILSYFVIWTGISIGAFLLIVIGLTSMGLKNKYGPVKKDRNPEETMTEKIFNWVVKRLLKLAWKFKLSYHEINIILYFFVVPFSWFVILDALFEFHYLKLSILIFCMGFFVGCTDFKLFATDLYRKSVQFLMYFNRFGSNYIASSVLICLVVPICIYVLLIYFLFR
jgi:hypothetical protein